MNKNEVKFLYLSQEDMIEAGVLDMHKCVEAIDEAFKLIAKGDYLMGGPGGNKHGLNIVFPKTPRGPRMPAAGSDRRFGAMVSYLGGEFNVCGEKWYGSNIANRERNLPRSILIVVLNDPDTGKPLVVMDGGLLSAMRTGAVVGVGAKYLAKKNSEVIGIIGAGVVTRPCLMSLAEVFKVREVKVFDLIKSRCETFCNEMKESLGLNVHPAASLDEAIRNSDVICLFTSGPQRPFVKTEWLKEGSYIAPTTVADFEDDFYLTSRIVVDNWKMHEAWRKETSEYPEEFREEEVTRHFAIHRLIEAGRIKLGDIDDLGAIALGTRPGRTSDKEIILLMLGGLPIEDVAWGYTVYREAVKKGIGQELTLWKKPFWR